MLKAVAKTKGHKDGWAAHKFRELFGVWPNHYKDAQPIEPSPDMLNWLKSRQIAWAHSKKNRPPPSSPQSWRAEDVLNSDEYLKLKGSIDAAFKNGVAASPQYRRAAREGDHESPAQLDSLSSKYSSEKWWR